MALTPMRFDKVWTNPEDFPTHETQEKQVRADIQYLFDSIRDQYNSFLATDFTAENLAFVPSPDGITSSNVQGAIDFLFDQIQGLTLPEIVLPDGSVVESKLGIDSVTESKIQDSAVTTDKLADGAITPEKLASGAFSGDAFVDGSIPVGKLGLNSVVTDNIANNQVTYDKLAKDAVDGNRIKNGAVVTDKIADLSVTEVQLSTDAVTSTKIKNEAVTSAKIYTGAVTNSKLASESVTTAKIADLNVTEAKLSADVAAKINSKQKQHTKGTITLISGNTTWTVSAEGVTETNTVIASPAADDPDYGDDYYYQWSNCGVRCCSQGDGTLSFKSRSQTAEDIVVSFVVFD